MQQRAWILPTALLAALALTGLGCDTITNKITEKATESIIENSIENESGGKVNFDASEGELNYKAEDGTEVSYGANLSLPKDFPSVIPVYQNGEIISTSKTSENASYVMTSSGNVDEAVAWFESQLSDWKQESNFSGQGFTMRTFTRSEERLNLTISGSDDEKITVSVTYSHAGVK